VSVRLRLVRPSDVETVYGLLSDLNVIRWMMFPLYSHADAETFVTAPQPAVLGPGRYSVERAIVAEPGDGVIGLCGLVVDRKREDAEAWYLLDPACWGRGYGVEAMRLLLATGFEDCGLHRVWACVVPENRRSVRVLEKAGLRYEGHSVRSLRIRGEWHDSLLYALLAEEWAARRVPPAP